MKKTKKPVLYIAASELSETDLSKFTSLFEGIKSLDVDVDQALDSADIVLLLSNDKKLLNKAWKNGTVTITSAFNESIQNYDPITEKGNSFVYKNANQWEIFAAIVRAIETFKFPYDWKFIKRSCLKSD